VPSEFKLSSSKNNCPSVGSTERETTGEGLRFEVITAVTMKNGVFWDITPRRFCKK
jgi:hypothetical protein